MIDLPPEHEPALDAFEAAQAAASVGRIAKAVGILRPYMSSQAANAEMHYVFGKILIDLEREEVASGEVYEPFRLKFPWGGFHFPNRDHFAVRKVPEAETHLRRALDMSVNQSGARALLALQLVQNTATVREGAQLAAPA